MPRTRSFTTQVVVRYGWTDVTVRRADMDPNSERWLVEHTHSLGEPIEGFDAAMEVASRAAMILEEARGLRELASVVESRLDGAGG